MRHRNLFDKRSKRKIVAENRQLWAENTILKVAVAVGNAQLAFVVAQKSAKEVQFAQGGIVTAPKEGSMVSIANGPDGFVLSREMAEKLESTLGQGVAAILPDHEANQKKETR